MLSRVLGLLREIVFAALFTRVATDAFVVAFTIPNLLRRLLAEGILSNAFVPVFAETRDAEDPVRRRVYGSVFTLFVLVLAGVAALGVVLSPVLVKMFAPGFDKERMDLAVVLTRVVFPYIFLVGLASFWIGILHTHRRFGAPALGPVLLNVGIITGALTLRGFFSKDYQIMAMAVGVLIGGILQLILQIVALWRDHIRFRPVWNPQHPAIARIMTLMGPTLLGLGIYQLNVMISRALASLLPKGSVTYLSYSDRLMELPLGVIAVAFATVNLPTLSAKAQEKDWDSFHETLAFGLKGVLFACIPTAIGMFLLREPIITLLFQRGHFTPADAAICAHVFAPAAWGLVLVAVLRNLTPAFYAVQDTKTPVRIAFISLLLNLGLAWFLAFFLKLNAFGLTLANTLSAVGSVLISVLWLQGKIGALHIEEMKPTVLRVVLASGVMGAVVYGLHWWMPILQWKTFFARALHLGVLIGIAGIVFAGLTWAMGVSETRKLLGNILRLSRRFIPRS